MGTNKSRWRYTGGCIYWNDWPTGLSKEQTNKHNGYDVPEMFGDKGCIRKEEHRTQREAVIW